MNKLLTFLFVFAFSAGTITLRAQSMNGFGVMETGNGTIAIYSYPTNTKNIIIPERINGLRVTSLGTYPIEDWNKYLDNVKGIETIIIPNTVVEICSGAFMSFVGLKSITIPRSVKSIGSRAFQDCYNLQNVVIPDGVEIAQAAFKGCGNIDAKVRQDLIKRFGEYIFKDYNPQFPDEHSPDLTIEELIEEIENMSPDEFFRFLNGFS
jgi:hypothetical protein